MLDLFKKKQRCGVTYGSRSGYLGVFVYFKPQVERNSLLSVKLTFLSSGSENLGQAVYTFLPISDYPFCQSIELPLEYKEVLVGSNRRTSGSFQFEFLLQDQSVEKISYTLEQVLRFYRGVGPKPDSATKILPKGMLPDNSSQEELSYEKLVARSEGILEARRKEAEAAEVARKEAEQKKLEEQRAIQKGLGGAGASAGAAGGVSSAPKQIEKAKVGLVYGSSTGNTAEVAGLIKAAFGEESFIVANITEINREVFAKFDNIILGVPTWHIGEMQDDWAEFLPRLDEKNLDLKGKKIAIFGLGDMVGYPDTYVDAMGELWDKFQPTGVQLVGQWPTEGYNFQKSKGLKEGKFIGMVIDVENQNELTEQRVNTWVGQLKGAFS